MEANHTLHPRTRHPRRRSPCPRCQLGEAEHSLDELGRLVATAGLVEAERQLQRRERIDPAPLRRQGQGRRPSNSSRPSVKPT